MKDDRKITINRIIPIAKAHAKNVSKLHKAANELAEFCDKQKTKKCD